MMEQTKFGVLLGELEQAAFSEGPQIRQIVKKLVPEYTYKTVE